MLIYTITNTVTGKQYVGQTVQKFETRKRGHLKAYRREMLTPLYSAFKSYGLDAFEWEVVRHCESVDELNVAEIELICELNTLYPAGYNLTEGGCNGKYSEKSRSHMSEIHTGVPLSEDHRAQISDGLAGNKNTLGMVHSDEAKKKISQATSGAKNPMYGKKHPPEVIEKIRAAARNQRKKVINNG